MLIEYVTLWQDVSVSILSRGRLYLTFQHDLTQFYRRDQIEMKSRLLSVVRLIVPRLYTCFLMLRMCQVSGSSPLGIIVQLISGEIWSYVVTNMLIVDRSAAVIIFEHSFYIFDKRRYLRDQPESVPSFRVALEQYMASPHATAVREDVDAAVQAYEEAVATAAHAYEEAGRNSVYQGHFVTWMAKLRSERFRRNAKEVSQNQARAELTKTILEITLNHRLRMFNCHIVATVPLIRLPSARP
jgi:hypothetical protein